MKRFPLALAGVLATLWAFAAPVPAGPALDYTLHCRGCHGPDGAGVPPDVPDLRARIGRLVVFPEGREYVLRVPGVVQSELSDARTAAVLNWIVSSFADVEDDEFAAFTEAEVARFRRLPLVDIESWTRRLGPHFE